MAEEKQRSDRSCSEPVHTVEESVTDAAKVFSAYVVEPLEPVAETLAVASVEPVQTASVVQVAEDKVPAAFVQRLPVHHLKVQEVYHTEAVQHLHRLLPMTCMPVYHVHSVAVCPGRLHLHSFHSERIRRF